ncbi:hydrogenase maturation protease [Streptosporangiaceae bacterium NEAU-GS5]|nr:hydrogenase maturation protease [Streptosporangiaceae bacterium NEAU-GS5]
MTRTVVIGIGNDYRGDDAIGLAVARLLRGVTYAEVVENGGDPIALIDAWTGADLAIVIDATRSGCPPGTVTVHDGLHAEPTGHGSTHALSLADAIELGRALDRLPARLVVIGIEGADFTLGAPLSPPVEATLPEIARTIEATA